MGNLPAYCVYALGLLICLGAATGMGVATASVMRDNRTWVALGSATATVGVLLAWMLNPVTNAPGGSLIGSTLLLCGIVTLVVYMVGSRAHRTSSPSQS